MANARVEADREALLRLMDKKKELECKIECIGYILHENGVDMTEPLVDGEGFPRNDIDVAAVRQARHDITCFQNERRELSERIERGLNEYYEREAETRRAHEADLVANPNKPLEPFATVRHVLSGYAGEEAGLERGDQLLQVGSLYAFNFKSLEQIKFIMATSNGRSIRFRVRKRAGHEVILHITAPKLGVRFNLATENGH